MKKIMLIGIMAAALLMLAACEPETPPPGTDVSSLSDFSAYYEDGVLHYQGVIEKPTPCHEITVDESPGGITRIDFTTTMPGLDEICAQVITPEEISNSIEMGKPDTIVVYLDGVLVHEESVEEIIGQPPIIEPNEDGFGVWYTDGILRYSARIEKPTPCHALDVEELIMESFPVQVRVNVDVYNPDPGQICIQVIDVVELEGSIEIDHLPASFSLFINGQERFRTSNIQEINIQKI